MYKSTPRYKTVLKLESRLFNVKTNIFLMKKQKLIKNIIYMVKLIMKKEIDAQ